MMDIPNRKPSNAMKLQIEVLSVYKKSFPSLEINFYKEGKFFTIFPRLPQRRYEKVINAAIQANKFEATEAKI